MAGILALLMRQALSGEDDGVTKAAQVDYCAAMILEVERGRGILIRLLSADLERREDNHSTFDEHNGSRSVDDLIRR